MSDQTKLTKPRVGVVLSSGGIRGVYAHTGFLMALEKMDFDIKAVAGCSAGAVVGGMYASGTPVQEWADAISKVNPKKIWSPSLSRMLYSFLFRKGRGYTGMSSTKAAINFCRKHLKAKMFEDCQLPFYTLAKNLLHGCKTVFDRGELAPRIVASAAAPLMFEPVEINNQLYCDGALLELSPTDAICCKHQLDILIIHHVARRNKDKFGIKQVIRQPWSMIEVLNMLLYQQRPWYLSDDPITFKKCPCGCEAIIIVIEPALPELLWPANEEGAQVLQIAKQQAEKLLESYLDAINNNISTLKKKTDNSDAVLKMKSGCGAKHKTESLKTTGTQI
ncbi:MAG: patatin-like phospholipase family protein [Woeseiaceae bacterium]